MLVVIGKPPLKGAISTWTSVSFIFLWPVVLPNILEGHLRVQRVWTAIKVYCKFRIWLHFSLNRPFAQEVDHTNNWSLALHPFSEKAIILRLQNQCWDGKVSNWKQRISLGHHEFVDKQIKGTTLKQQPIEIMPVFPSVVVL